MSSNLSVAPGYCQCGCGTWVGFWENTSRTMGRIKGEPKRLVRGHGIKAKSDPSKFYVVEDRGFDTPCWIWQKSIKASGHGQLKVNGRVVLAHRHYYEKEKGPIPKEGVLVPLCGVRTCVNPEHQEVISKKERTRRSGRSAHTKLDKKQIENMRREAENTGHYEKVRIAKKYGISRSSVYRILQSHRWAD